MDSLTAAFKALEQSINASCKWAHGTAARQTRTRGDGRTQTRVFVLPDATAAFKMLQAAAATGNGEAAAVAAAMRVVARARWHDANDDE